MTTTHTYAIVGRDSRDTVEANGDLFRVWRPPSEAEAFYLPSGHYRVDTISGPVKVEAPVYIVFDNCGYPYPIAPQVYEQTWYPGSLPEEYRS